MCVLYFYKLVLLSFVCKAISIPPKDHATIINKYIKHPMGHLVFDGLSWRAAFKIMISVSFNIFIASLLLKEPEYTQ